MLQLSPGTSYCMHELKDGSLLATNIRLKFAGISTKC